MKRPFDFVAHIGVNFTIIEDELSKRGFEITSHVIHDDFAFRVYKNNFRCIKVKYRVREKDLFADSFIIY